MAYIIANGTGKNARDVDALMYRMVEVAGAAGRQTIPHGGVTSPTFVGALLFRAGCQLQED